MAKQLLRLGRDEDGDPASVIDPGVLGRLLVAGGDSRINPNPVSGLNNYGCHPFPQPGILSFASSTASSISERAFAAVGKAVSSLQAHDRFADLDPFVEEMRTRLKALWGIGEETDIVFAPSGTDAELRALFLAKCVLKPPIVSIVVGSDETGSGMPLAAAGRHFDSETANRFQVSKGERIHGLAQDVEAILIPTRAANGRARPPQQVDTAIIEAMKAKIADGYSVILHVMAHSKLGTCAPTPECVRQIREVWSGSVQIIDDVCQTRVCRAEIQSYVAQDRLVLITGSKFFTGPAFSGAVLVSAALSARAAASDDVPIGLLKYTCAADWPPRFRRLRSLLPPAVNLGQALRWTAAIEEMDRYFRVPAEFRRAAFQDFSKYVMNCISGRANLRLLQEPASGNDGSEEFSAPTVFPFLPMRHDRPCSMAEARLLYRAMNKDLSNVISASAPSERRLISQRCHIGQPVQIPQCAGRETGVLRVSADARLVSESWVGGDEAIAARRLRSNIAKIRIVFDKLDFLLQRLDELQCQALPGRTYYS